MERIVDHILGEAECQVEHVIAAGPAGADIDGTGTVDINDYNKARKQLGTHL